MNRLRMKILHRYQQCANRMESPQEVPKTVVTRYVTFRYSEVFHSVTVCVFLSVFFDPCFSVCIFLSAFFYLYFFYQCDSFCICLSTFSIYFYVFLSAYSNLHFCVCIFTPLAQHMILKIWNSLHDHALLHRGLSFKRPKSQKNGVTAKNVVYNLAVVVKQCSCTV